jgi:hypothetical protein
MGGKAAHVRCTRHSIDTTARSFAPHPRHRNRPLRSSTFATRLSALIRFPRATGNSDQVRRQCTERSIDFSHRLPASYIDFRVFTDDPYGCLDAMVPNSRRMAERVQYQSRAYGWGGCGNYSRSTANACRSIRDHSGGQLCSMTFIEAGSAFAFGVLQQLHRPHQGFLPQCLCDVARISAEFGEALSAGKAKPLKR